jgi:Sulfotransferase domain
VAVAFCVGLNRTGTTTFGDACDVLGFSRFGWMRTPTTFPSNRLMKAWERNDIQPLVEVAENYDVLEDLPWPLVYREMAETFPDAKFALTRRSSVDVWLTSIKKHTSGNGRYRMHELIYGSDSAERDPDLYRAYYEKHLLEVKEYFSGSNRLIELCWEEGDGWPELCGLLGVPEPEVEFPHSNIAGSSPQSARRPWAIRKAKKLRRKVTKAFKGVEQGRRY